MVNLFTGDFTYKIPLLEIPGPNGSYPLVLNYQSGSRMNDEASWVGFGWNLNTGVITRELRGIPDDFSGDIIKHTNERKPNRTYGLGVNASLEVVGADFGQAGATIGLMGIYNNYRGFTVTRNLGVSYNSGKALGDNLTATAGLDISLDNSSEATVSLQAGINWAGNQFNGNTSFNSREGLSDLKLSYARNGFGGGYSFAKRTYIPNPGPLMESFSVQLDQKLGGELFVVMLYGGVRLSYTQTQIKENVSNTPAFGYMYLHKGTNSSILDFNREKDGILSDQSPNLAIPSLTHDIFSVSGDGMEGSFRAFRTDVPVVYDKEKTSGLLDNIGGGGSAEVGFGNLVKIGLNANTSMSYTSSGKWDTNFKGTNYPEVAGVPETGIKEYFFFKFNGETNLDRHHLYTNKNALTDLFQDEAIRPRLEADDVSNAFEDFVNFSTPKYEALSEVQTKTGSNRNFPETVDESIGREPRARTIQHFTNREINDLGGKVGELLVEYMDENGANQTLTRPNDERLGAFIIHGQDGKRYVYALPVYNTEQHERRQSARCETCTGQYINDSGTYNVGDEFYYQSDLPPYAYAFLLTAVLGNNYVDLDSLPGPTTGDIGFYVNFLYQKRSTNYLWRSPFSMASFDRGFTNSQGLSDDKLSVLYGRKEIFYLQKALTKTHYVQFHTSERFDGWGASDIHQNSNSKSGVLFKLDSVRLFSMEDDELPIKRVKFTYDSSLVPQTPNSTLSGKLTLRQLAFAYEFNNRGYLSPYEFTYHYETKPYLHAALDRWGNYDESISESKRLHYPYTSQKKSDREALDISVSNWQIKDIVLPSGGKISVSYESDTFGYVQDKRALQMCDVISPTGATSTEFDIDSDDPVYFQLNDAIPVTDLHNYFDGLDEVYFKINMKLKPNEQGIDMYEYVEGYAKIENYGPGPVDGNGLIRTAWVKFEKRDNNDYHPFSVAAWQHLRFTQPELLSESLLDEGDVGSLVAEAMKAISFVDMIVSFPNRLRNFNSRAYDDHWGRMVRTDYSYIRLNVPDKKKYGGGVRVKRIMVDDRWDVQSLDPKQVIGQVYYYENEDGTTSGIAAYEPIIGGEENPFRRSKRYRDDLFLNSDHFQYIEEPSNEGYFPSPVVGYSRVKVRSIIADSIITQYPGNPTSPLISSTGEVVHEFYTALDFPTKTDETSIKRRPFRIFGIVPFIGSITFDNVTASQGYSVVLNNMHGQPKKVSYYALRDTGSVNDVPVKTLEYHYTDKSDFLLGENLGPDFESEAGKEPVYNNVSLMDVEMFADMRQSICYNGSLGINGNVEIYLAPTIPPIQAAPSIWPAASFGETETKTAVFNKIISKKYVLSKMVLKEAGNISITTNHVRDAITGDVILSSVNNKFNRKVFTYNIPAYWKYSGMASAYRSIGLKLPVILDGYSTVTKEISCSIDSSDPNLLPVVSIGDEYSLNDPQYTGILVCKEIRAGKIILEPKLISRTLIQIAPDTKATLFLVRPGRRNQLSEITETLVTLKDPRLGIREQYCYPGNQKYTEVSINSIDWEILSYLEVVRHIMQASNKTEAARDKFVKAVLPKDKHDKVEISNQYGTVSFLTSVRGSKLQPIILSLRDKNGTKINLINKFKVEDFKVKDTVMQRPAGMPSELTFSRVVVMITDQQSQQKFLAYLYANSAWSDFVKQTKVKTPVSADCDDTPTQEEGPTIIYSIDSVLNVSVTTYSDNWPYSKKLLRWRTDSDFTNVYDKHISKYGKGERGIWRAESQFSYVTVRQQHAPVQLQHDGIFDEFIQFDWTKPNGGFCANWVMEKKVTSYSPFDFAIQQNNMLDIPTASIFGHKSAMNIAVANVCTYNELGFEGFEEFYTNQRVSLQTSGSGNIDFATETRDVFVEKTVIVDIAEAYNDHIFEIIPEVSNLPSIRDRIITGDKGNVDPIPPDAVITSIEYYPRNGAPRSLEFSGNPVQQQGARYFMHVKPSVQTETNIDYRSLVQIARGGKIKVDYREPLYWEIIPQHIINVSDEMAHTGKRSLRVKKNIDYQQTRLSLIENQVYVFSGWVKLRDSTAQTYDLRTANDDNNVGVRTYFSNSSGGAFFKPSGPIIEGWQKIEGEFTAGAGDFFIRLQNGNAPVAFFDDLRISPRKSLTETYVFDPRNYRLCAILDNNNFATFYSYDEEGSLYLVRKETERGIYTIKEIRAHTFEH